MLWRKESTWTLEFEHNVRTESSKLLGDSELGPNELKKILENIKATSLRSIAIVSGSYKGASVSAVVACDGTRAVSCWFHDEVPQTSVPPPVDVDAAVFLQPADALCVSTGNVRDLELRDEAEDARAVDLVAVGMRSGATQVSAIREKNKLSSVRLLDAASAPVSRASLPRLSQDDRGNSGAFRIAPAPVITGTSSGKTQVADLRRGIEWQDSPMIEPSNYADALSVVHKVGAAAANHPARLRINRPIANDNVVNTGEASSLIIEGSGATASAALTLTFVDKDGTPLETHVSADGDI